MRCPACDRGVSHGDWLCPFCEHVLDPSVLGVAAVPEPATFGERTRTVAWAGAGEDALPEAMILGDVTVDGEDFEVWTGPGEGPDGRTSTFLYYAAASPTRVVSPDAIPRHRPRAREMSGTPYERFVLSLVDGRRSVRAIRRLSGLEVEEIVVTVLTLLDRGAIDLKEEAATSELEEGPPGPHPSAVDARAGTAPDLPTPPRPLPLGAAPPPALAPREDPGFAEDDPTAMVDARVLEALSVRSGDLGPLPPEVTAPESRDPSASEAATIGPLEVGPGPSWPPPGPGPATEIEALPRARPATSEPREGRPDPGPEPVRARSSTAGPGAPPPARDRVARPRLPTALPGPGASPDDSFEEDFGSLVAPRPSAGERAEPSWAAGLGSLEDLADPEGIRVIPVSDEIDPGPETPDSPPRSSRAPEPGRTPGPEAPSGSNPPPPLEPSAAPPVVGAAPVRRTVAAARPVRERDVRPRSAESGPPRAEREPARPRPNPESPPRSPPVDPLLASKAAKLYEQALADEAAGNLVSARMNMKLALTFEPGNELYARGFEQLAANPASRPKTESRGRNRARELYDAASVAEAEADYDEAIRLLEAAIRESKQAAFLNRLGVLLAMRKREFVKAQELIEEAIELAPGQPTYERNLQKVLSMAATHGLREEKKPKRGGLFGLFGRRR